MARKQGRVGVVIPAGGRGQRLGAGVPKQFLPLRGKPMIRHSIAAFEQHVLVDEIVVVVPDDQVRPAEEIIHKGRFKKVSHIVAGGRERQHSVRNGLLSFNHEPEIVLVHDAARPLVTREIITGVIRESRRHGAAVVGVPVKDTLKTIDGNFYSRTLDRSKIWAVQTPQGFRFGILQRAHLMAQRSAFVGTDEASLVERLGIPVRIVEGSYQNIKITTAEDFEVAKLLLK